MTKALLAFWSAKKSLSEQEICTENLLPHWDNFNDVVNMAINLSIGPLRPIPSHLSVSNYLASGEISLNIKLSPH